MKILIAIIAIIVALLALSTGANSQTTNCAHREQVAAYLASLGQKPLAYGISFEQGRLIELYQNKEAETWVLVLSDMNTNQSCLVAQGTDLTFIPEFIPSY